MLNYLLIKCKATVNELTYVSRFHDERQRLATGTLNSSDHNFNCGGELRATLASNLQRSLKSANADPDSTNASVLCRVAESMNAPAALAELAFHENAEIRIAVAENSNTPHEVLRLLADDVNPDVRYVIAENCNVPKALLEMLCSDENPYVAARAQRSLARLRKGECSPIKWRHLNERVAASA